MSTSPTPPSNYASLLKASTILGGAQGINYLITLLRIKVVAVLLGPGGVGLISLYQSLVTLMGTVAGLGLGSSGIRSVAEAHATGNAAQTAVAVSTLRRLSWMAGIIGWLVTAALSYPISSLTFGDKHHALGISILGACLLFGTVSAGQMAVIQGVRRIGDIARLQILATVSGTFVAVVLYTWLREEGIIPVLILTSVISFACTWWFSSKIKLESAPLPWRRFWNDSKHVVSLGLAFVWSAVLAAAVAFATRFLIIRDFGTDANGIYQSAWAISGMFAGFLLSAMGTDYFPRLSAVAHDHSQMNRLVNEQTEIGILLAFPGLLGTMVFAPWLMQIFYSAKFVSAAPLLPWFVLGIFFKIISWPMGFIMQAKGATRLFVVTETLFNVCLIVVTILLLKNHGPKGAAYAYALLYGVYILAILAMSSIMTGFRWSREAILLLVLTSTMVTVTMLAHRFLPQNPAMLAGATLSFASIIFSGRQIVRRLGPGKRWVSFLSRIPFSGFVFNIPNQPKGH